MGIRAELCNEDNEDGLLAHLTLVYSAVCSLGLTLLPHGIVLASEYLSLKQAVVHGPCHLPPMSRQQLWNASMADMGMDSACAQRGDDVTTRTSWSTLKCDRRQDCRGPDGTIVYICSRVVGACLLGSLDCPTLLRVVPWSS